MKTKTKIFHIFSKNNTGENEMKAETVREKTLLYFNGDTLATDVWMKKYALKNKEGVFLEETPDDMHVRIAKEFHRIESRYDFPLTYEEIYESLKDFKYIVPQGSPMSGIGNNYSKQSLSNCVVIESPEDSMSSIFDKGKEIANLFKSRCGVGMDISKLRPEGTPVNNSAKTSTGAWSFCELYSHITRMVGQNNRRGALMLTMDVRHPDIFKFVTMKQDLTKVTGANVSVRINDEFMGAVENDDFFILRFPCDIPANEKPDMQEGIVYNFDDGVRTKIRARDLWEKIVDCATKTAEPGILMWDNITKNLPADRYPGFKTICTNPCLTDDTWIHTSNGRFQISELLGEVVEVDTGVGITKTTANGFFKSGEKPTYRIHTKEGFTIDATDNHKFSINGKWMQLKDIKIDDKMDLINPSVVEWGSLEKSKQQLGYLLGFYYGDGWKGYGDRVKKNYSIHLGVWKKNDSESIRRHITECFSCLDLSACHRGWRLKDKEKFTISSRDLYHRALDYKIDQKNGDLSMIERESSTFIGSFLSGMFDADGHVEGNCKRGLRVRLSQSNKRTLQCIQRMLFSLGIYSKIYKLNKDASLLPDGRGGLKKYNVKQRYCLDISGKDVKLFEERVGFVHEDKKNKLYTEISKYTKGLYSIKRVVRVEEIEYVGIRPVYDCTVPEVHHFSANGFKSHNCSELPLSGYDSCRLISVNLKSFVVDPFSDDRTFDFEKFREVVRIAIRLSDDLIDLELEKLETIRDNVDDGSEKIVWERMIASTKNGRRIGLGTHGLADCLSCLGIKYGSLASQLFCDTLYKEFKETSYDTSVELAVERGVFPAWQGFEYEKGCQFFDNFSPELIERMTRHGRRNISLLTNAPTGSVSILSQTSSGIEPVFRNFYERRRKLTPDEETNVDFIDSNGDKFQMYKVWHHNASQYLGKYGVEDLPDYFIESDKIWWEERVELQGIIQRHIDHAISSTTNLPKGTTKEVVEKIYMSGWKKGLKGITVYVDGCRDGVLVTSSDTVGFKETEYAKRPEFLEADIHRKTIDGKRYIIMVGLLDGRPYEVFSGLEEKIQIPRKYEKGKIRKRKYKTKMNEYDLLIPDDGMVKDIVSAFNNPDNSALGRMISLGLRYGAKINHLVEQLQQTSEVSSMTCFSRVLARVLKQYIPDGTIAEKGVCPECDENGLVYKEGCVQCSICAWSKCS